MTIINLAWTAEIIRDTDVGKARVEIRVGRYKLFGTTLDPEPSDEDLVDEALAMFDDFLTDVVERAELDDLTARFERHSHGTCEY